MALGVPGSMVAAQHGEALRSGDRALRLKALKALKNEIIGA